MVLLCDMGHGGLSHSVDTDECLEVFHIVLCMECSQCQFRLLCLKIILV